MIEHVYDDSPIHPVLKKAHEFAIVRFDYHVDHDNWRNSYLDLHLQRATELGRLRFRRPQSLRIEEGFPNATYGMVILDITHRQWDDVRVQVTDFEASHGKISF